MSIELWRLHPFYDFSPAIPAIRKVEFAAPFTIPAQNADIEWAKENFNNEPTDRSITGRIRSNIMGNRLTGSIQWNDIIVNNDKTVFLFNLYFAADAANSDRIFSSLKQSVTATTSTVTFVDSATGTPSSIENFYTGMLITSTLAVPSLVATRRIISYNGETKVATLDGTLSFNVNNTIGIWIPIGIPFGFYLNTTDTATKEIACVVNSESSIGFNVENRIITQPVKLSFLSRDLIYESFVDTHPFIRTHP